jgi:hypothetical protein
MGTNNYIHSWTCQAVLSRIVMITITVASTNRFIALFHCSVTLIKKKREGVDHTAASIIFIDIQQYSVQLL